VRVALLALLLSGCARAEPLDCPDQGHVEKVSVSEGIEERCVRWDGRKHGPMKVIRKDGTVYMTASYKEDGLDGVMTTYKFDGAVYNQSVWKNDRLVRYTVRDGEPVK
jgi:hypothetical protein